VAHFLALVDGDEAAAAPEPQDAAEQGANVAHGRGLLRYVGRDPLLTCRAGHVGRFLSQGHRHFVRLYYLL